MSEIIDLLERMASNVSYSDERTELAEIVEVSSVDKETKDALLHNDNAAIEGLLDARTKIVCLLVPAKEDEDESEDDSPEQESEESSRLVAHS